jgi:hypothetical protein
MTLNSKPTEDHSNADGLSRLPLKDEPIEYHSPEPSNFNYAQINSVTNHEIQVATRTDPILSKVYQYTRKGWPSQVPESLKPYQTRSQELTVEGGCVLWGMRVIIPKKLQETILSELHRDHPGVSRMKSLARCHMWWPGLDKSIEDIAKSCIPCQSVKQSPPVAPLHPWIWPRKPWQRVHVDFAGPFMGKMFFIAVDAHSKWPEVYDMTETTSFKTIAVLRHVCRTWITRTIGFRQWTTIYLQ